MSEDQPGPARVVHVAVHATSRLAADILIPWLEVAQMARWAFDVIAVPDPDAKCGGAPPPVPQGRGYDVVVVGSLLEDRPVQELLRLVTALGAAHAQVPVVIISDNGDHDCVCTCINHGARGFIPTTTPPLVALAALEIVILGGTYVPPLVIPRHGPPSVPVSAPARVEADTGRDGGPPAHPDWSHLGLTPREQDVLALLALGQSNKQIARKLGISESTAMVHVRNLMRKMGATNRTQTVFNARRGH